MLAATSQAVRGWLPFGLFDSDKVRVDSKNNEDERSSVGDSFTVQNDTENGARGGQERHQDLFLLERGPVRVLGGTTLQDLVKLLSEFIGFPIGLYVENLKEKAVTDSEEAIFSGAHPTSHR